jgi:ComF family protein
MLGTRRWDRWLASCVAAVDALVYPMACAVCGREGLLSPFCDGCRGEILEAGAGACARCAMPLGPWARRDRGCDECRGRALGFDGAVALGPYQGPIRHLCLRLKQERNAWLAPWLIDLLVEARAEVLRGQGAEAVVPIPLHWRRHWRRGFNQAEALARRLARRLGLVLAHPLRRVVATPALARRGRVERVRLMEEAFRAAPLPTLRGRTVLLVDDILTTGATCGAAARALKRGGVGRVAAVVIGRAEGMSR